VTSARSSTYGAAAWCGTSLAVWALCASRSRAERREVRREVRAWTERHNAQMHELREDFVRFKQQRARERGEPFDEKMAREMVGRVTDPRPPPIEEGGKK
jgi:hypothetical protein